MKKIMLVCMLLSFTHLSAFELEINMGAGGYYTGSMGKLIYTKDFWKNSSGDIDHASDVSYQAWTEISSDMAYWPKLRLEFSTLDTRGQSFIHIDANDGINTIIELIEDNVGGLFKINNTYYDSRLRQNTYEAYLFYEYFEDTGYPTLGLGAGFKEFQFSYTATILEGLVFTDNGGDSIPMIFARSRYEFDKEEDGAQLGAEISGKALVGGDSNIYDTYAKVDFLMPYNKTTDIGIEFGYKLTYYDIKGSDIKTVGGDMQTSGVFFSFVGHFR